MRDKKGILIAYGELFLKSEGVRNLFQRRLLGNLCFFLNKNKIDFKTYLFRERIFIETKNIKKASRIVRKIFGLAWYGESFYIKSDLKEISSFIAENHKNWIKKGETFAIRLKLEKGVLKESRDRVIDVLAKDINRKVDLSKPSKEIFIEIRKKASFIYFKKKRGLAGFPVGASPRVLSLVSGGIDSLPAAYLMAKRGAENIWVHFHSYPLVSKASIEKVEELAKVFLNYQPKLKVYFIPFSRAQTIIKAKALAKYRVLIYRRLMLKIAENIAQKENCQALVTGESLGQVSSQTLDNIRITQEIVKIPVLRPLIGQDKEEIINIAKKIGTYSISIKPHEDCCTLFVSKGQTASGKIEQIKKIEKKLEINKMVKECLKGLTIIFT